MVVQTTLNAARRAANAVHDPTVTRDVHAALDVIQRHADTIWSAMGAHSPLEARISFSLAAKNITQDLTGEVVPANIITALELALDMSRLAHSHGDYLWYCDANALVLVTRIILDHMGIK